MVTGESDGARVKIMPLKCLSIALLNLQNTKRVVAFVC